MKTFFYCSCVGLMLMITSCLPKKDIEFKGMKNIVVSTAANGQPLLTGDAIFFNPNGVRMKLRKAEIDVKVNERKSAEVRQQYNLEIPANSNFTVPVEAQLELKEIGLLDTLVGILGGKKYKIQFIGLLYGSIHGVRVKVPVNHTEEARIKL